MDVNGRGMIFHTDEITSIIKSYLDGKGLPTESVVMWYQGHPPYIVARSVDEDSDNPYAKEEECECKHYSSK